MQSDDHVWRWRNAEAGDFKFASQPWQEALRRKQIYFDIDSLDPIKQSRRDRTDDNYNSIRNGDGPIY